MAKAPASTRSREALKKKGEREPFDFEKALNDRGFTDFLAAMPDASDIVDRRDSERAHDVQAKYLSMRETEGSTMQFVKKELDGLQIDPDKEREVREEVVRLLTREVAEGNAESLVAGLEAVERAEQYNHDAAENDREIKKYGNAERIRINEEFLKRARRGTTLWRRPFSEPTPGERRAITLTGTADRREIKARHAAALSERQSVEALEKQRGALVAEMREHRAKMIAEFAPLAYVHEVAREQARQKFRELVMGTPSEKEEARKMVDTLAERYGHEYLDVNPRDLDALNHEIEEDFDQALFEAASTDLGRRPLDALRSKLRPLMKRERVGGFEGRTLRTVVLDRIRQEAERSEPERNVVLLYIANEYERGAI